MVLGLTVSGGLPDIDAGVGKGLARNRIGYPTVHESRLGIFRGVEADSGAILAHRVIVPVKGTQDSGCGESVDALCRRSISDIIDKTRLQILTKMAWTRLFGETHVSNPMTSHISCDSLRFSLLIWPAQLIISTPRSHSSLVSCTSLAKA